MQLEAYILRHVVVIFVAGVSFPVRGGGASPRRCLALRNCVISPV